MSDSIGPDSNLNDHSPPGIGAQAIWQVLSQTPGVGVSLTDVEGRLIFVNETAQVFFNEETGVDYLGKYIADFHPEAFVRERLLLIKRVTEEGRPLSIKHIYHGHRIVSTIWPVEGADGVLPRVLVVTRSGTDQLPSFSEADLEVVHSQYIDLGPLEVLSDRELEVLVLLGHGLSVPETAKMLHRSSKTVERHKSSISNKLNVSGHAELVAIVTSIGLEVDDVHLQRLRKT